MSKIIKSGELVREELKVQLYKEIDEKPEVVQEVPSVPGINGEVERIYDEARKRADRSVARILEDAYAKRDKIVNTAEEDVKRLRARAQEEGMAQGYAQAAQNVKHILEQMEEALSDIQGQIKQNDDALYQNLIELSAEMASRILHKRLDENEADMLELARDVVLDEKDKKNITLQVSSRMTGLVEQLEKELEPVRERYQNVIKIKPMDLDKDACRVETSEGITDASLFVQLANLKARLKEVSEQ